VGTTALGWTLCAVLLIGATAWLALKRPWQSRSRIDERIPTDVTPHPQPDLE
jgi:hypothetical protein